MDLLRSAAAVALLLPVAAAQDGVRLIQVPPTVRLPAAAGANLLLEVEVDATVTAVWLATDLASRDRVPLQAVGERRWQLNLADARVAPILPAGRDGGELLVFAAAGGATRQSAPVAWARATSGDGRVRCLVRSRSGLATFVDGGASAWLDAATLERIELQGAGARQTAAVARLGTFELPLLRRAGSDLWVLDGDATLRERAREAAALEIEAKLGGASALFRFSLVPEALELPEGGAEFALPQRGVAPVPGSNGWLQVHVGDITGGSALVRVATADRAVVVGPQLLRSRDFVEVPLGRERYVIVVEQLVNVLVGTDRAALSVRRAAGFRPDPIGLLLKAGAASGDAFVRDGRDHTGTETAQFLATKLAQPGPRVTLDEFVEVVGSASSASGEAYRVRRQDGSVVTMQQWLRAALRDLDAAKPPARR